MWTSINVCWRPVSCLNMMLQGEKEGPWMLVLVVGWTAQSDGKKWACKNNQLFCKSAILFLQLWLEGSNLFFQERHFFLWLIKLFASRHSPSLRTTTVWFFYDFISTSDRTVAKRSKHETLVAISKECVNTTLPSAPLLRKPVLNVSPDRASTALARHVRPPRRMVVSRWPPWIPLFGWAWSRRWNGPLRWIHGRWS